MQHEIHITSEAPIKLLDQYILPMMMTEIKAHVKGFCTGVIEENMSPYAAPTVPVKKRDG